MDERDFVRVDFKIPDSKVHGANMGPTWVLSAPDGPHVGPMNRAIRAALQLTWTGDLPAHSYDVR